MRKRIVETDNYGRDYPNESFLPVPAMFEEQAKLVAKLINEAAGPNASRYWKVVDLDYRLAPDFAS